MGYRKLEEAKKEWAEKGPEYLQKFEEEGKNFDLGCETTYRRIEKEISRERFAEALGVSIEELERIECGDFWESREETEARINQAFNSLNSKLSQPK